MHNLAYKDVEPEHDHFHLVNQEEKNESEYLGNYPGIVGESDGILKVFNIVEKVADSDSIILINGATGTGKGLIAKAIHNQSYRKDKPFITINCGAIPENLLESELFGHERGAFTGATSAKPGKFELADHGTIFLDEIGDMSPDLQVKLLRVLEENEFERIGGIKTICVDTRVIAATHQDLENKVASGEFREDLYYRLCVIPIMLPPLKERRTDIPLLISYFINQIKSSKQLSVKGISDEAMDMLTAYSWPGNIRELKNYVERLVVLNNGHTISSFELDPKFHSAELSPQNVSVELSSDGICFNTAVKNYERALILQSLEKSRWIKKNAAKLLHLKRTTLVEKIKRHNIEPIP